MHRYGMRDGTNLKHQEEGTCLNAYSYTTGKMLAQSR